MAVSDGVLALFGGDVEDAWDSHSVSFFRGERLFVRRTLTNELLCKGDELSLFDTKRLFVFKTRSAVLSEDDVVDFGRGAK